MKIERIHFFLLVGGGHGGKSCGAYGHGHTYIWLVCMGMGYGCMGA